MKLVEGKSALVTGAGRGIGKEVALDLAINGANVAVAARTKTELDRVVEKIEAKGVKGLAIPVDLSNLEGVSQCAKKYFEAFPTIDVLINNAGMTHVSNVVDTPLDYALKLFNLNMMSYYALIKLVLPKMIEQKSGSIVMTSSVMGTVYFAPMKVAYASTKAAVAAMGKCLSAELKPYNINVNVVAPAGVETKMAEDLRGWGQRMDITISPDFISPAYLYLASDLALKKYNGRVLEIHIICDEILPMLSAEIGEKEFESKELKGLAGIKLNKRQLKVFKKNSELIEFMLKYKR
ncbi:MAG: SDR family NAD(P)-dependent oxidoreductase [Promethearchaeota archaeon]|jgi:3-oxoacyl-[acyl-carrier protein] reductase